MKTVALLHTHDKVECISRGKEIWKQNRNQYLKSAFSGT